MASFTFNTTRQPKSGKRERKTVSSAAVGITPAVYTIENTEHREAKTATAAVIEIFAQAITWTIDGTTPVGGTVGFESQAGDFIYLDSAQKVKDFKAIRSGGTDGSIEVTALFGA